MSRRPARMDLRRWAARPSCSTSSFGGTQSVAEQRNATTATDAPQATPEELRSAVWQRVQQARNVKRPHTLELIHSIATEVIELHGDRLFRDDPAIVGGFC